MGIEEKIKQNAFASEAEKAFVNIGYTQSYISNQINNRIKEHNISIQQYNVLRILKGQHPKPVSINNITDRMVDKMSNASRLVEKLRTKNLIERKQCSFDKRQVDVCLTDKGIEMLMVLTEKIDHVINDHLHLKEEEYSTLNRLLDSLRKD